MVKKTIWDMGRLSVEEYRRRRKIPLTVVVDNVRSLNNIGSLLRTCDAFGVERVALCGITATPPSAEIHKTALGAEDSVEWVYYPTTGEALDALEAEGYVLSCLEQVKGSVELGDFVPEDGRRYALVCGNEVDGVAQDVVDRCGLCLEIPQIGTKHSLNVTVSTAVAIWHFFNYFLKTTDIR